MQALRERSPHEGSSLCRPRHLYSGSFAHGFARRFERKAACFRKSKVGEQEPRETDDSIKKECGCWPEARAVIQYRKGLGDEIGALSLPIYPTILVV